MERPLHDRRCCLALMEAPGGRRGGMEEARGLETGESLRLRPKAEVLAVCSEASDDDLRRLGDPSDDLRRGN